MHFRHSIFQNRNYIHETANLLTIHHFLLSIRVARPGWFSCSRGIFERLHSNNVMSSPGHWEVVIKNKKVKQIVTNPNKLSKTEKKKFAENAPKVEDILPLAQVKNLYSDTDTSEEIQDIKKTEKEVKPKDEAKKTHKKQTEKKKEVKDKNTKTSQELDEGEFLAVIAEGQARYSNVPLVWLRDLTVLINSKLSSVNCSPTHPNQLLSLDWPSKLLPQRVLEAIEAALDEESAATKTAFFGTCLTAIANDMSRGLSAVGHKIMLQKIITLQPEIAGDNVAKAVAVKNSYQNRPPICLSLLGAVGQAGLKDINVGIKVWLEVMFPLIENRNYTRWVTSYLGNLIQAHESMKGKHHQFSSLEPELYFQVLDRILPVGNSLTSQVQKELMPYLEPLRNCILESNENNAVICFPLYLKRLQQTSPKVLQNENLEGLLQCLSNDPECFDVWSQLYAKHLHNSAILLRKINSLLEELTFPKTPFLRTLKEFQVVNENLIEAKKKGVKSAGTYDGLEECHRACNEILDKLSHRKKKKGFPFIKGSIFCIFGIIALILYDINKHSGIVKDSSIGHFLSDIGAPPVVVDSLSRAHYYHNELLQWSRNNLPGYMNLVYETTKPHVLNAYQFVSHWATNCYQFLAESYPPVKDWIDVKAPGLREKAMEFSVVFWNGFTDFMHIAFEGCVHYSILGIQWMKENVFVGHLSPENIQRLSLEAYNTTQTYAILTFDWIVGKFQ